MSGKLAYLILLEKNMLMKLELGVVLPLRIPYIQRDILKELSRILNKLKIVVVLIREIKRNTK